MPNRNYLNPRYREENRGRYDRERRPRNANYDQSSDRDAYFSNDEISYRDSDQPAYRQPQDVFTGGSFGRGYSTEYRPDPSTWGGHGAYEGVYDRPARMQSRYGSDPNNSGRDAYDRNRNYEFHRGRRSSREDYYGSPYPERDRYLESERGYETRSNRSNYEDERGWWDKASDEVSSWMGDEEAARRREADHRRHDSYRGRGPKNYKRSDDRIREDLNDRLTDYTYLDASDIDVEVSEGDVVLTGTVHNRYAKRMAEDLAEDVSGVKNVENRLRVNGGNSWDFGMNTPDTFSTAEPTEETKSFSKKA